ncbi:ankyrin repeat protein [Biomphalaria glabrata]|nr:ankyrin repeat protein [Biomphalaria glabrata]
MPQSRKRKINLPTETLPKQQRLCRAERKSLSRAAKVSVTRGQKALTKNSKQNTIKKLSQTIKATEPVSVRLEQAIHFCDNYSAIKILTSSDPADRCSKKLLSDVLLKASVKGMLPTVRVLLKQGAALNKKNILCGTPLTAAVENGFLDLAEFLIEKGADVNLTSGLNNTALIIAIKKQYSFSLITNLVKAGADLDVRNHEGKTAAMIAVERYDLKSLLILLKHGACLEIRDLSEKTVLDYASERNILEAVQLMSENCSDLNLLLNKALEDKENTVLHQFIDTDLVSLCSNNNHKKDLHSVVQNREINSNPEVLEDTKFNGIDFDESDDLNHEAPGNNTAKQVSTLPICVAAAKGKMAALKMLLSDGIDVNIQDNCNKMTPLMFAAANGHVDVVKYLHSQGADITLVSQEDFSALTYAIKSGHLQCVKLLLKLGAAINTKLDVFIAATENQINCLKLLSHHIDAADLDIEILSAAVRASNIKLVKFLIDKGMDVNAVNYSGESILLQSRNEQMSRLLIKKGAVVDCLSTIFTEDENDEDSDKEKTIAFLIKNGANLNEANVDGILPLIKATVKNKVNIAKVLLDGGASPDVRCPKGLTALMYAAQRDFTDMISLLLQQGASVNAETPEGRSVLMFAAMNGCEESVRLLLAHGADVHLKDKHGETALLMTTHDEVVKLLVDAGADVNIRNNEGLTPLQLSKMTRRFSLQKTLECLGARTEGIQGFSTDNGCTANLGKSGCQG